MNTRQSLQNKTAIITGAGRGIGQAIAIALAREGVHVSLLARSTAELEKTHRQINDAGGRSCYFECDLSDAQQLEAGFSQSLNKLGGLDILINNAGTFLEKPVDELKLEDWQHVMDVNLTAPYLLSRYAIPELKKRGGGRVINIASTASKQAYLNQSAYVASKHGLLGFARAMAMEVKKDNIHVHTLCPGGVDTELIKGTYLAERLKGQPTINPDNIAEMVVYLLNQPGNIDIPEITMRRFIPEA